MALTKAAMAEMLFDELGLNKREAKDFVEQFFEEIRLSLERNEQVKLSGYGNFDLRDKKQRPGRNPKTGEAVATDRILPSLAGKKFVLLGESHANAEHHRWQLHTLAGLNAHHSELVVGFEMFPRRVQPAHKANKARQVQPGPRAKASDRPAAAADATR